MSAAAIIHEFSEKETFGNISINDAWATVKSASGKGAWLNLNHRLIARMRRPKIPALAVASDRRRGELGLHWAEMHRINAIHAYIMEAYVTLSVRLDPIIEAKMKEETKRLGITKSQLVKDALELRLGLKNPYDILRQVRGDKPMGNPRASESAGAELKVRLRAKHSH
jgi:hypothetical protein